MQIRPIGRPALYVALGIAIGAILPPLAQQTGGALATIASASRAGEASRPDAVVVALARIKSRKEVTVDGMTVYETAVPVLDSKSCARAVDAARRQGAAVLIKGAVSDPNACGRAAFPTVVLIRETPGTDI